MKELVAKNGEIVSIEIITPAIARTYLAKNIKNRKMKLYSKERFARDMKTGNWSFNGSSCICFAEDGSLINGQTRLQACVDSGSEFETIVVKNIKIPAAKDIDTGNSRSMSDFLKMDGYKHSLTLSSTAKKVLTVDQGKSTRRTSYSSSEILSEIENPQRTDFYIEAATIASSVYCNYSAISKTNIAAVYVLLRNLGYGEDVIVDFFEQLIERRPCCGIISNLRKKIANVSGRKFTQDDKYNLLVYTWNEYISGNTEGAIIGAVKKYNGLKLK